MSQAASAVPSCCNSARAEPERIAISAETRFTELGLTVSGKRGDALVFCNILPDGRSDGRTRHAGLPVTSGGEVARQPLDPWRSLHPLGPG